LPIGFRRRFIESLSPLLRFLPTLVPGQPKDFVFLTTFLAAFLTAFFQGLAASPLSNPLSQYHVAHLHYNN
jgi:hypothetical protein